MEMGTIGIPWDSHGNGSDNDLTMTMTIGIDMGVGIKVWEWEWIPIVDFQRTVSYEILFSNT